MIQKCDFFFIGGFFYVQVLFLLFLGGFQWGSVSTYYLGKVG